MKLKVSVTDDHIKRGVRCAIGHCPVAISLTEQTGRSWLVDDCFQIVNHDAIQQPEAVTQWIYEYDRGNEVKPFEFEIELPEGYLA